MSKFVTHTNCEKCGSSDARALYKGGGSFCFSCRTLKRGALSPYLTCDHDTIDEEVIKLPDDASFDYSSDCLEWVFKYGVTIEELIKHKVYWSERRQQLLFTFWDNSSPQAPELLLYQARNFGPPREGKKPLKYYTKGQTELVLPVYASCGGVGKRLVLVEDCISAIKISRYMPSMPVLGSDLSLSKLKRLAGSLATLLDIPTEMQYTEGMSKEEMKEVYKNNRWFSHLKTHNLLTPKVVIWLDGNMYDKACRLARRLQMLGVDARAVYTEKDPKEYSDAGILSTINCNIS